MYLYLFISIYYEQFLLLFPLPLVIKYKPVVYKPIPNRCQSGLLTKEQMREAAEQKPSGAYGAGSNQESHILLSDPKPAFCRALGKSTKAVFSDYSDTLRYR